MAVELGGGKYTFVVRDQWAKVPDEIALGDVAAVGVDAHDRVYAFNRGDHPVAVFDAEGNLLRTWGEGVVHPAARRPYGAGRHDLADRRRRPHGAPLHLGRQGADDARRPGRAQALYERRAVSPLHPYGDLAERRSLHLRRLRQCPHPQIHAGRQVADVVGRARHRSRASSTCRTISAAIPTAGSMSPTARTTGCRFSTATASSRPSGTICTGQTACAWRSGPNPLVYIGEGGPSGEINRDWPNIGPRVSIHTHKGEVLARLGKMHAGLEPGHFTSPHGIAVDRHGNIFVGELSGRSWGRFSKDPPPKRIRVLHKLEKSAG